MTAQQSIDLPGWMAEQLSQASPDLLRAMLSAYDLTCRSGYDLTCRFRQGDHVMGSLPATRVRRSLSR
jgi:hypothetical protein